MPEILGLERNSVTVDHTRLWQTSRELEKNTAREILEWAVNSYGEGLTLSVSFGGAEGMVLLDMLSRIPGGRKVRVFTIDTGFLFDETVRFRERVMERYPLKLEIVRTELSIEEQVARYGEELRSCSPELCCQIRKVEPQRRYLRSYGAWATGIRRDQTQNRADTPVVEWDEFFGVAKVSPLVNWSSEQVREYVREYDVPTNPLLSQGYRSIGCAPQTRPVGAGEDPRAGRWPGMEKDECGIHVANGKVRRANS